jgi:hypothetical protein
VYELTFLASSDKSHLSQDPQVMRNKILWNAKRTLDLADAQLSATQKSEDLDPLRLQ